MCRRSLPFALALVSLTFVLGCSDESVDTAPLPGAGLDDGLPPEANPLRSPGVALLPFPSAIFLEPDGASPTGQRVKLSAALFPENGDGAAYEPVRMNRADGFSAGAEILAYFPERLDPKSLPSIVDPSQSLEPGSATVIVDMESGARVPHFAEVDDQVYAEEDRQSLIIRPVVRLASGRRYAIAITRSANTLAGAVPSSPPGWSAILDGKASDETAKRQQARMPEILAALDAAGVARADLVLAWDLVTASDEGATRALRSMREQTLAELGDTGLGYAITSVEDEFSEHALRRVRGTFTVPKFLSETDIAVADATLSFEADGSPKQSGTYEAPFTLILPRSATKGPVRLLVFGHGFLGSGEDELGGASGSYMQQFADAYGYALVATDWVGLSKYEGLDSKGSGAAAEAVQDFNKAPWIGDRLQQAIVNAITLARTARGAIAKDPQLYVSGAQVIDDSRIDYYGISLGGVLGSVLMGFSPDLERGVLNVGAAGWSTLLQRSTNWALFKLVVDGAYPDKLDQQILIEVLQAHLDPADGMTIAPHVLADPIDDNPAKRVLLQMAVADAQVPNVATEIYARSLGLSLLDDSPKTIYALEPTKGPLPSALTVWDTHERDVPPTTNKSTSATTTNSAHGKIRALPKLEDQIDHFLRMGEVVSTCDGPCDPE